MVDKLGTAPTGFCDRRSLIATIALLPLAACATPMGRYTVEEAVRRAVEAGVERIIVEVDRIDQIEPALAAGATHLLLDNMDAAMLRQAVALDDGRVPTEASGGVTLDTIRAKASTGVTYISVGRLTQSAPAADIGLDFAYA